MPSPVAVSVVIPAFNRERLLSRALKSVQNQTFAEYEIVVVDDRSTDQTASVVREFASADHRVRYVLNQRSQGPAGARNCGVAHARGEFIAFLDSDDEWMPYHLERAVQYLRQVDDPIDVFTANPLRRRAHDGTVVKRDMLSLDAFRWRQCGQLHVLEHSGLWEKAIEGHRILTTQTIVARRTVLDQVQWAEEIFGMEDCLFPIEVAYHGFRIGHLQDFHVTYWVHDDNLTNGDGTHAPEKMLAVFQACVRLHQAFLRKFPLEGALRRRVELRLADHLAWSLGYNGYSALGEFGNARECYWSAIRLAPTNWRYWKVLVGSYFKQLARDIHQ